MCFSCHINFLVRINSRIRIRVFITRMRVKRHIMNVKLRSQLLRRSLNVIIPVVEVVASWRDERAFGCLGSFVLVNSLVLDFFRLVLLLVNSCFFEFVLRTKPFFAVTVENFSFRRLLLHGVCEFLVSGLYAFGVVHVQSTAWSKWVAETLHFVYHKVLC